MIKKILIANRGEIAVRIIKTCRKLNIKTVAIYSDGDQKHKFAEMADESYSLNGTTAAQTYLDIDKILDIAKKSNADAIHPGYGFLSENAGFATRVTEEGFTFIGPGAEAILAMGMKSTAKQIMQKAGVSVLPGYNDDDNSTEKLVSEAQKVGYPLLIKAAAGGGGKGMRVVNSANELSDAISAAKREAQKSFANDKIIIEKYLAQPRHIEVQVMCDTHGNNYYLFERDCSIQRRYQKVIEEAPAPNITEGLRKQLGEQAILAAKAINYVGAGTIEFLLDTNNNFYFMEMNTRLQVEHPVSELITGLDLVALQINVANGDNLQLNYGLSQDKLKINGHAIEARIYAEDVHNNFLPASGEIKYSDLDERENLAHPNYIRIDSGIRAGDIIGIHYDPMLAKVISHGKTRQQAIDNLSESLAQTNIIGFKTNIDFLVSCLQHQQFKSGQVNTSFINNNKKDLLDKCSANNIPDVAWIAAAVYYNFYDTTNKTHASINSSKNNSYKDPWLELYNYRVNLEHNYTIVLNTDDSDNSNNSKSIMIECLERNSCSNIAVSLRGLERSDSKLDYRLSNTKFNNGNLEFDARVSDEQSNYKYTAKLIYLDNKLYINYNGKKFCFNNIIKTELQDHKHNKGSLSAPMHGTIVAINVDPGTKVVQGDALVILEAMKMEHVITAPRSGVVTTVNFKQGEQVSVGAELLVME